jgi:hypothetical protein
LVLPFLEENVQDKVKYFMLMNNYLLQDKDIDIQIVRSILTEYLNYLLVKLTSSFIFSVYNERIKYKKYLSSVNMIGKKFKDSFINYFLDSNVFEEFHQETITKLELSSLLMKKSFLFDYFNLRGRFVMERN